MARLILVRISVALFGHKSKNKGHIAKINKGKHQPQFATTIDILDISKEIVQLSQKGIQENQRQ